MQQVHGNRVQKVTESDAGKTITSCDGLITRDPNISLVVKIADCLPISIKDKKSRAIGLIHAGWRGLDKKIITTTLQKMAREFSSNPEDFDVLIGPHICGGHYEVKSDVSGKFVKYSGAVLSKNGKTFLDLAQVAKLQLIESGVDAGNITIDKRCTFEEKNLFSFRRNKTEKRNIVSLKSDI